MTFRVVTRRHHATGLAAIALLVLASELPLRARAQDELPVVEPWECFWRVELEGVGWFFGGRAGFYGFTRQMDFGIAGATGDVAYEVIRFADDPWRSLMPLGLNRR